MRMKGMKIFLFGLVLLLNACSSTPSITEAVLQTGVFYPVAHEGSGTVKIVQQANGKRFLKLSNFSTTNGPAIYVWLSTAIEPKSSASISTKASDYLQLGNVIPAGTVFPITALQLEIPDGLDISSFKSVVIWCVDFKVNFASAALKVL